MSTCSVQISSGRKRKSPVEVLVGGAAGPGVGGGTPAGAGRAAGDYSCPCVGG